MNYILLDAPSFGVAACAPSESMILPPEKAGDQLGPNMATRRTSGWLSTRKPLYSDIYIYRVIYVSRGTSGLPGEMIAMYLLLFYDMILYDISSIWYEIF